MFSWLIQWWNTTEKEEEEEPKQELKNEKRSQSLDEFYGGHLNPYSEKTFVLDLMRGVAFDWAELDHGTMRKNPILDQLSYEALCELILYLSWIYRDLDKSHTDLRNQIYGLKGKIEEMKEVEEERERRMSTTLQIPQRQVELS